MLDEQQSKNKIVVVNQRDQRGVAPAHCWTWGGWGLKEYKWKGTFIGLFLELVVSVQETFILSWLLWSAHKKYFYPYKFMCPHRPATWASSRAGPPVSEWVSPWLIFQKWHTRGLDTRDMYYFTAKKEKPQFIPWQKFLQYFQKNWDFGFLHAVQWRLCEIFPTWLIFCKEIKIVRDTVYIHL